MVTVPVWDTVSPAAAKSVQLSVQHVSANVQVISRDLFHGAGLRTSRQIYRSPARDTWAFGGVREGGEGMEGDACCLRTNRGDGTAGFKFRRHTRVHTPDLKPLLPYNVVLKLATSSHVCIHGSRFVLAQFVRHQRTKLQFRLQVILFSQYTDQTERDFFPLYVNNVE